MRKAFIGLLGLTLAAGLTASFGGVAAAGPPSAKPPQVGQRGESPLAGNGSSAQAKDELPNPEESKRRELRERALSEVIAGKATAVQRHGSTVVRLGSKKATYTKRQLATVRRGTSVKAKKVDQYVELSREKTDKIFVVLAEFGNTRATDIDPRYGDIDTDPTIPGPTTFEGPVHNSIPGPDRAHDNSTVWQPDYSAAHYRQLYFGKKGDTLKTYYEKQSSGRYSVSGMVTDWVKVKYNEARYGRSDGFPCAGNVCSNTWNLLKDALDQWVVSQKAKGQTDAQIKATLASYDQWDRNDFDGDGNFNEPDGYIDHFQIVHAGGDQADGDPYQGEDAIWSHRWKAFQGTGQGPANNPDGGTQIGSTGLWVADYTIQPENGGLSVFAHEYGHDLGLPDEYDTQGSDGTQGFWTLMAQSRLSAKNDQGIGTRPGDLNVWDKLQLGWLDYEVALAGQKKKFKLGPHEYNSKKAQGLVVVLPDKQVVTTLPTPPEGTNQWYSGTGDDLDNSLARQVILPAGSSQLSFQANYDIEDCGPDPCDYAYVQVDDGSGWTAIPGSITTAAEGNGINGTSDGWVPATFDLSAYAGKTVSMRIRYVTDGAAAGNDPERPDGLFVDDIEVTAGGTTILSDGAENGNSGWTADGFTIVGASISTAYKNYYLASNRSYVSFDKYLKTGPYNFGFLSTEPDKVEHFPYQPGLLVNYWDTSFADNNVSVHPFGGQILPVDAHPQAIYRLDGAAWRGRIGLYDAPFSKRRAASFTLHVNSEPSYIRGRAAQPLFDDTRTYYDEATPDTGVRTPGVGVTLRVLKQKGTSMTVQLGSRAPRATAVVARR